MLTPNASAPAELPSNRYGDAPDSAANSRASDSKAARSSLRARTATTPPARPQSSSLREIRFAAPAPHSNASRLCKFWALGAWECTLTKDLAGVRASGMKDVAGLSQSKSSMHGRTRRSTGTRSDTAWQPTSIDGSRRQSGSGASEVRKLTHHHGPLHEGRVRRQAPVHWKTNGHVVGWEELSRVASVPWAIWLFSGDGP